MSARGWTAADAVEAERRYHERLSLTLTQAAHVLNLTFRRGDRKGDPDRRQVVELLRAGRLRVVDPSASIPTVSGAELARYLNGSVAA